MKILKNGFARCARLFSGDRKGVTAMEYALIAAVMAGAIIAGVGTLGSDITSKFTSIGSEINNPASSGSASSGSGS